MILPLIKFKSVGELRSMFGWDNNLNYPENIRILEEKFLIYTLKQEGFEFDFTIAKEEKGKPYFKYNDKVHFSVTDSKDYIAVAVCDKRIGIDIEYLRKDKMHIAERYFHPNETAYLHNVTKEFSDAAFTQLWTIKEAYVKMTGTGIAGNFITKDLTPESFDYNQDFYRYNSHIVSYFDTATEFFVSICTK
ncbi:MAG: 4'-phosphopantetheinyl transferase superfamily protein [Bacteroidales bacterium]|nr:4'-phosphopantetheinyl transferase superfamily protein [Bacteroidales bacterium]